MDLYGQGVSVYLKKKLPLVGVGDSNENCIRTALSNICMSN